MRAYVTQNKLFEVTKTMSTLKIYTNRQIYRVCVYFCTVPMKIMWRDERAGGRFDEECNDVKDLVQRLFLGTGLKFSTRLQTKNQSMTNIFAKRHTNTHVRN